MATFWTLAYNGTEQSFAAWGLDQDSAELSLINQGTDIFSVRMVGVHIEDDPVFPFEAQVTIQSGRAAVTGGGFSGGTIEFQGKRTLHILEGRPEFEGVTYQFAGPWYDLDQTPYQQSTIQYTGPGPTLTSILLTDLVLFQKVVAPGELEYRNNGQQISDILQHLLDQYAAQGMAAPYQIGTINPATNMPTYQARDLKCSEAIELCLRCSPSAVFWFDYSTAPPTANCMLRASLGGINVAIADGIKHESLQLTPRYDLQPQSVVVYFKSQNVTPTGTWISITKQKEPSTGPDGGLRVVVQTIDLAGFTENVVTGNLSVTPVTNDRTFWEKYVPELRNSQARNFSVGAMTITDESGNPVSLATYPNVLDDGSSIKSWMTLTGGASVVGIKATIVALASWDQYDVAASGDPQTSTNGRLIGRFIQKELHHRLTLTNGVTGPYSTISSWVDAEPIPIGVATSIYNELSTLQYQGTVSIVEAECDDEVIMGAVLNLTNGRAEWTTMNAQIQQIRKTYGNGRTVITIGPAQHLSAGDLTQIFLANRLRRVWYNPSIQGSASSQMTTVDMGGEAPKENTNVGLDVASIQKTLSILGTGNATEVVNDAANQQIVLQVTDPTGAQVSGQASVKMDLPTLGGRAAAWQWLYFKDAKNGCAAKKMLVMGTAPEADT